MILKKESVSKKKVKNRKKKAAQLSSEALMIEDHVKSLKQLIKRKRKILFACVGTDRSTGDSLGPIVGTVLKSKGYEVIGTLDDPLHALNLYDAIEKIENEYSDYLIIAIDAVLGKLVNVGNINIKDKPLKPGAGVGKDLPEIGHIQVTGNVNVGGFMEFMVLQNTRLSLVLRLANQIVEICTKTVKPKYELEEEELCIQILMA